MPITKFHRPRIGSTFLTGCTIRKISATSVHHFPLLFFGDLHCIQTIDLEYQRRLLTSGWIHKFFLLVKPIPVYDRSFSFASGVSAHSIRYAMRRFSSAKAFSISGTVREQYINLRRVGYVLILIRLCVSICIYRTCWYETIKESKETVFPVPEGISRTQCPYRTVNNS
jgi:hypothetical protein